MENIKKRLVLIDSNALLHRAYHALPPLTKKDGTLTNAVYGYALTLLSVLEKFKPDYIVATFDLAGPTFRHEQYKDYKATRKKAPDEFYAQIPMAKELLKAFNIPIFAKQGYEADDVIGTIAKHRELTGNVETVIVTGDLDTLQLVDEKTQVFTLRRGITDTVTYDIEKVKERYGLEPSQMIEYKALRGDQSDNIPGVKGIGEKTAIELLLKYGTVDKVYENIDLISSASVARKLREGKESAYMSRELATINTNVPIDFDLACCHVQNHNKDNLLKFFQQMEFYSLVKRLSGKDDAAVLAEKADIGQAKGTATRKGKKAGGAGTAGLETGLEATEIRLNYLAGEKDVDALIKAIGKSKRFACSFAVTEDKYSQAEVSGLAVYNSPDKHITFVPREYLAKLGLILADKDILKIGYNVKFEMQMLAKILPDVEPEVGFDNYDDVQIAAYLLRSGTGNNLDKLVFEEFGKELEHQVVKKGQISLLDDGAEVRQKAAAERAFWIWRLHSAFKDSLKKISQEQAKERKDGRNLEKVYSEIELPLVPILARMELAGVRVNRQELDEGSALAEKEIAELEKKIYKLAGSEFNINSPGQLAKILYEDLGIPTQEIKRGKTGYSTDADQLRKIRDHHPVIAYIEQYREMFKVKTTYTDTLPVLVEDDGRIHAHFNQAVTATGRLSSSDPNLQNIPKKGRLAKQIRSAFVAEDGYGLVSADYSQIDLRAAAHLADDPRMIESFTKGKDIHRTTAAWVNNIPENEVTDQQRSEAKSLNFGVLYGMGTYGFMRDSGVSRQRAEFFIDQYMKQFANLKKFIDSTKEFAQQHGYVETELGRRRYIPNIKASNYQLRNAAERMAINLPVQGLAADIMKLAMLAVDKLTAQYGPDVRLILQIHDELIFEVKYDVIDAFMPKLKACMESVYQLRVPLVVEVSQGQSWAEL